MAGIEPPTMARAERDRGGKGPMKGQHLLHRESGESGVCRTRKGTVRGP